MKTIFFAYHLFYLTVVNSQSTCDDISFVDRAEWGARKPILKANLPSKSLPFYVIHHSADSSNCYDDASCTKRVQQIQYRHQYGLQWFDIGYHFLIGENGKVYEGRGWNHQAAHSRGWNNDAYGICIIGDFRKASPNEKALNALRSLVDCGVKQGYVKEDYYIITHRQTQPPGYTECPGNGTLDVVSKWPRYCSFQNSRVPLKANETQIYLALNFCEKEFSTSSLATAYLDAPSF